MSVDSAAAKPLKPGRGGFKLPPAKPQSPACRAANKPPGRLSGAAADSDSESADPLSPRAHVFCGPLPPFLFCAQPSRAR